MTAQQLPPDVQRTLEGIHAALLQAEQTGDAARRRPMLQAACSGITDIAVYLGMGDGTQLIAALSDVARLGGGALAFDTWLGVRDVGNASVAAGSLLGILRDMPPDLAVAGRALAEARSFWFEAMRPALVMACARHYPPDEQEALVGEAIALAQSDETPAIQAAMLAPALPYVPAAHLPRVAALAAALLAEAVLPDDFRRELETMIAPFLAGQADTGNGHP